MKKYIISAIALFVISIHLFSQTTEKVAPFKGLSVSGNIEVNIVPSADEGKVEYEILKGDKEDFKIEVKENTLRLKAGKMYGMSKTKVKATVYYNQLQSLSVSAGATLSNNSTLSAESFSLSASSGGSVKIMLSANTINVSASSGASVSLNGKGDLGTFSASSGASVKGQDFVLSEATASSSSGAGITLHVTDQLTASSSSGGTIKYKGAPKKVTKNKSVSGGSVKELN